MIDIKYYNLLISQIKIFFRHGTIKGTTTHNKKRDLTMCMMSIAAEIIQD